MSRADTNACSNACAATASFTPTSGDLLVVMTMGTGTSTAGLTAPTCSSSVGITFTTITAAAWEPYASTAGFVCIADSFSDGSSTTVTVTYTNDNTTGAAVYVARVSGMSKTGSAAYVQKANGNGAPPAATFSVAPGASNPVLGMLMDPDSSTATAGCPTGWTEHHDGGWTTPTEGSQWCSIDSGAGTTNTWASSTGTAYVQTIELDASAAAAGCTTPNALMLLGAGCN